MNSGCVVSLNTPPMHQLSNHILSRVHKRGPLRHRRLEHRLCVTARGPPIPFFCFSCLIVVIQHHSGWLAAAFLIQHASAVNPVSVRRVDVRLCVRPD